LTAFACVECDPELQDPDHQRLHDPFERYDARRTLGFARVRDVGRGERERGGEGAINF
jgi:hypothetical protein